MAAPRRTILHIIDSLSVGGAEQLIKSLAEHIDQTRFAMHVCCLGVQRGNALQAEFEQMGVPLHIIGAKKFYGLQPLQQVRRILRDLDVDLVHTHLTSSDVTGRLLGRLAGLPVVSTLHNIPANYDRARFDRRWLQRLTARHAATHLVAVSPTIRQQFIDAWGIPQDQISTIYNAVPMDRYGAIPARPARETGAPVVITNIGRLSPQKGQRLLLDAFALVVQQQPAVKLMIVGQGRLEEELNAHAAQLGLNEQVVFTGLRRDIPQVLADSDVFVLSSLWEGLPVTAVEAMAAARPAIVTDVGGNRDVVEHGRSGVVVPPNDVRALATAMLALATNPEQRVSMGEAARERVRDDFSIGTFTSAHEALYTRLLDAR